MSGRLKAIYCSGWQVAADANVAGQMYPDQSLYPVNSVPQLVERIRSGADPAESRVSPAALASLVAMVSAKEVSRDAAREVLTTLVAEGGEPRAVRPEASAATTVKV